MILTFVNFFSLCALAIGGAVLVVTARRIYLVIKQTERRISKTVDEKNLLAQDIRALKKDEAHIRQSIEEAEAAIEQMTRLNETVEKQIESVKLRPRRSLNMIDLQWRRFDRLWEAIVTNPSMPNSQGKGVAGPTWGEGRPVHGFARAPEEFLRRVTARFSQDEGFVVGDASMVDLNADPPPAAAAG